MAAWAAVGLVLGVTLVSGPLVGFVDFTGHTGSTYCESSGDADVTVREFPVEAFAMEPVNDDGPYYTVTGPPTRVEANGVQGCPVLAIELRIPTLGFKSVRKSFLSTGTDGRVALSVVGGRFDPERIGNESYRATVELRLEGNVTRTLSERAIILNVSER